MCIQCILCKLHQVMYAIDIWYYKYTTHIYIYIYTYIYIYHIISQYNAIVCVCWWPTVIKCSYHFKLDEDPDGIWKDAKIRTAFSSFLSFWSSSARTWCAAPRLLPRWWSNRIPNLTIFYGWYKPSKYGWFIIAVLPLYHVLSSVTICAADMSIYHSGWIMTIHQPENSWHLRPFGPCGDVSPYVNHHSSDVTVRSLRFIHMYNIYIILYIYMCVCA